MILIFFDKLTNWILQSMTTTAFSIIVNEKPCNSFQPERGIHQDDSISPIFLLYMPNI